MKFAKYTFLIAGIYGLLALIPQYFLETLLPLIRMEKNGVTAAILLERMGLGK